MKRVFAVAWCLSLCLSWLQALDPVVVSTTLDEEPIGLCAEHVMTEAWRRFGKTMVLERMPAERALAEASKGSTDAELFRTLAIEKDFPTLVRIPVVISRGDVVIFTTGNTIPESTWAGLEPYTVGYVRGIRIIEASLTAPTQAVTVTDYSSLFKMLAAGRIDFALADKASGIRALNQTGLKGIVVTGKPLAEMKVFHYLAIKHRDWAGPLTAILEDMQHDGFIAAAFREHFGTPP